VKVCGRCGERKPISDFYFREDRGTHEGVCKKCRNTRKAKKEIDFTFVPDLLKKRKRADTAVLLLSDYSQRRDTKGRTFAELPYLGLRGILSELNRPYDFCFPEQLNQYDNILVPITSVYDIENLIFSLETRGPENRTGKIIIGGAGVHNIRAAKEYIDVAVWGRAEGQINFILSGADYQNVWRKENDPDLCGEYEYGKYSYLVKGEGGCGCKMRCHYCQYSWTRKTKQHYTAQGGKHVEDFWNYLDITVSGFYITAFDGLTEETRVRVNRPLKDSDIMETINTTLDTVTGGVMLTCNCIVGFPWETPETVLRDLAALVKMVARADRKSDANIYLRMKLNPFSAEICTPMQYEKASCEYSYTDYIKPGTLYDGESVTVTILPGLTSGFAVIKRMLVNRFANDIDYKSIVFNSNINKVSKSLLTKYVINYIPRRYYEKIEPGTAGFEYLTDCRGLEKRQVNRG